jgi:hypothetical protein
MLTNVSVCEDSESRYGRRESEGLRNEEKKKCMLFRVARTRIVELDMLQNITGQT